ncbi:hypothetical protein HN51_058361 [Arachis hypogaea]
MELPLEEQIRLIKKATLLLESQLVPQVSPKSENLAAASADNIDAKPKSKPIDKQNVNNYSRMQLTVDLVYGEYNLKQDMIKELAVADWNKKMQ